MFWSLAGVARHANPSRRTILPPIAILVPIDCTFVSRRISEKLCGKNTDSCLSPRPTSTYPKRVRLYRHAQLARDRILRYDGIDMCKSSFGLQRLRRVQVTNRNANIRVLNNQAKSDSLLRIVAPTQETHEGAGLFIGDVQAGAGFNDR